jgi:2-polyprenyl-6-methoxyphenol hydroxylase-like FAD-dependent oxidoreductase
MAGSVLIVGAGPVGLATAIEMTRRGLAVQIVDQETGTAEESRAIGINPRTLDLLEPSGATDRLIEAGVRVRGARIISGGKLFARIDFARAGHRFDFMLALPQSRTEALLLATLRDFGREVAWRTTLAGASQRDGVAEAVLEGPDGQWRWAGDWIVGADGAHSAVRHALGIGFPGALYPFGWSLADVRIAKGAAQDEAELRLDPRRPILFRLPLGDGVHRLISNGPDVLSLVPDEWQLGETLWQSRFAVSHRQAERLGEGRIWLVGDAAHIHSPAGGRGMNLGIEDGATLAQAIAAGTLGDWPERRRIKAMRVIRESDAMQRLATADRPVARWLVPRVMGRVLSLRPLHDRIVRAILDIG